MKKKICFKCNTEKQLRDFYKHPQMKDGHMNKCIECTKKDTKERENYLRSNNPEWVKKERQRGRDKYKRLGYRVIQREKDSKKFWTKKNQYKNISRNLKSKGLIKKGQEVHHWNYNLLDDYFILKLADHRKIHKYLKLDDEKGIFKTIDGIYLDTREKHSNYIKGIISLKINE